ncbi:uncharacterized protein K452DRAFT_298575 [Aplosporella prunicola CBS 121167]|uniref:Peroxisomal membrane protein PEX14 n=1 Tax=Aplosporella prunicola CBS 121167 TaxID=1176127 RepID=A0A6A6BAQ1_9PEZI|nr:uncharacterized protein K452DRAFT_298575 [Aplosporella prunicola CBS 121167]KAF2141170.1 hypothetical protein K452DRAFT_298575 [Aplosporella prunicola CBS 121167]
MAAPKSTGIPAWQQQQQPQPKPPTEDDDSDSSTSTSTSSDANSSVDTPTTTSADNASDDDIDINSRASLRQQALRFLQDQSIRDASIERKRTFLRSKGLSDADIRDLLPEPGDENTPPATPSTTSTPSFTNTPSSTDTSTPAPMQSYKQQSPARDVPPIITYPEFLTQPTAPPPLITPTRVAHALTAAAGLAATLYGMSSLLVQPMAAALSAARHDQYAHANSRLEELNNKLAGLVSAVPAAARPGTKHSNTSSNKDTDSDDASSTVSDPTELYSRDRGTQTSPPPSPPLPPTISPTPVPGGTPADPTMTHSSLLSALSRRVADTAALAAASTDRAAKPLEPVRDLTSYLHELQAAGLAWGSDFYSVRYAAVRGAGGGEDDAVEAVRKDIRGVKGVLLAARNFPSAPAAAAAAAAGRGER